MQSLYSEILCGRWFSLSDAEAFVQVTEEYIESTDLSAVAVFQESFPLRGGMTHVRIELLNDVQRSINAKFQAETLCYCLGNRTPSDPGQKKVHFWNSPLYIGLIIGKIERLSSADVISVKSQILLDVIRFE